MICFLRRVIVCLTMSCVVIGTFMSSSAAEPASANPYAKETKQQHDARMKWWREARFGMFIHWGVYSVPAGTYHGKQIGGIGEWIMNRTRFRLPNTRASRNSSIRSSTMPISGCNWRKRPG